MKIGLFVITGFLAAGCSTNLAQNVYEGIQNRNESLKTPEEKSATPAPQSYRDYEAERNRLKGETPGK
ncbi:MAG: hypothetical protein NTX56_14580 [Proteobacteria bacterium]|nr:hypothetical protein [Pseudomonadota bacterium]